MKRKGRFLITCVVGNITVCVVAAACARDYSFRSPAELEDLCNGGEAGGCNYLGLHYAQQARHARNLGQQDPDAERKAAQYYQKACDGDDSAGCHNLANLYWNGDGVARDEARAIELLKERCQEHGDSDCCDLLRQRESARSQSHSEPAAAASAVPGGSGVTPGGSPAERVEMVDSYQFCNAGLRAKPGYVQVVARVPLPTKTKDIAAHSLPAQFVFDYSVDGTTSASAPATAVRIQNPLAGGSTLELWRLIGKDGRSCRVTGSGVDIGGDVCCTVPTVPSDTATLVIGQVPTEARLVRVRIPGLNVVSRTYDRQGKEAPSALPSANETSQPSRAVPDVAGPSTPPGATAAGSTPLCNAYGTPANKKSAAWHSRRGGAMRTGLVGTLVDEASGNALAGLVVKISLVQEIGKPGSKLPEGYPASYEVRTDPEGRFSFCLPPGQYGLIRMDTDTPIPAPGAIMRSLGIFDSNHLPFFVVPQDQVLNVPKILVHKQ
ncbi:MAG: hypothetical protein JW940_32765 [Polyangiaceae bacterium]|nr:hypothetical protein [Polyangiaceae bacterium]